MRLFKTLGFSLLMFAVGLATAAERGSAEEAVAMVKKAVAYMKEAGKDKAFSEFGNPANTQFHDRDLYIFVYDMDGNNVAHGNNPKMVGKNLLEMKDNDGKYIIKSFIEVSKAKGKGWVDYKWPNPVTKAVELKSSYVEKVDGLIVGAGIYK
ncbi:cache domain-containing protein [Noviherbaspirillum sp.]|uniref:cache domain-containing protein n=1 Tax=Noviherbaspirillum sp. TaxID=1926288 RepID=UPI002B49A3E1|nr:cache domain-containing protein [Noviherbaspirillum sp.]HJV81945.1 cache domain-containing protein [Noviherbaspirillum sp.]